MIEVMVLHLTFQIDNLSTSLESTNDKLKTMEEVSEEYRLVNIRNLVLLILISEKVCSPQVTF